MYAIIADGGRQYKVEEGLELNIDYRDVSTGDKITFDSVLAVSGDDGFKVGKPTLSGVTVTAEVVGVQQGKKIYIQKFARRKDYRRRTGHRQLYTKVKFGAIEA
jgi:large subunit ribosomal protein L21